jgi:endonuclease/exonuclease/phosphatase family metal-dependent hydrolase
MQRPVTSASVAVMMAVGTPAFAKPDASVLTVVTFNVSMFRDAPGALAEELRAGSPHAAAVARVLQHLRPDVVILNEIDADGGVSLNLLAEHYLAVRQGRAPALDLPYRLAPASNTGVPSGLDLDRDGEAAHPAGSRAYGADAWGFGVYPGQYGLAVLSRYPLRDVHTFAQTRWQQIPEAPFPDDPATPEPEDFWPPEVEQAMRASSKTHLDVTVDVGAGVHLLVSHPTPPVFDGPEDRNGARNAAELHLWRRYLDGAAWTDDAGVSTQLAASAAFILAGDLNADPVDGDGRKEAILALAAHPRARDAEPRSRGAVQAARDGGGANAQHQGDPALDTVSIGPNIGNLRLDWLLPSADLRVVRTDVFWPRPNDPKAAWWRVHGEPVSDHHPVRLTVRVPR